MRDYFADLVSPLVPSASPVRRSGSKPCSACMPPPLPPVPAQKEQSAPGSRPIIWRAVVNSKAIILIDPTHSSEEAMRESLTERFGCDQLESLERLT